MIARNDARVRRSRAPDSPSVTRGPKARTHYTHFGAVTITDEQAGYRSATVAQRDGPVVAGVSGSKTHEIPHREPLQRQSRQFRRDNGIYAGMIRRARSFIVGNGFTLKCTTKSAKWNAGTEASFREFWRRPEVTGLLSGSQVEDLVCDELLTCGELGTVLTNKGLIQLVEAEQIRAKGRASGGTDDGITRDEVGRPTSYSVCPYGPNGQADTSKARTYQVGEFLYLAALERPSAGRAVPPCQAVFPMLHRIDDTCDSEAAGWQVRSKFACGVNRAAAFQVPAVAHAEDGETETSTEGSPSGVSVSELEDSLILWGQPGDELVPFNQAAPASTFNDTLVMFFRLLGLPLGLPLELMLLDWTKSNYSQSRAVLEQAKVSFLAWQDLLDTHFYRPIFMWWLTREIEAGRIQDRPDKFSHNWRHPQPAWIDQLAETQAQGEKVDRGMGTLDDALKAQNLDPDTHRAQLEIELVEAVKACDRVQEATKTPARPDGYRPPLERFLGLKVPPVPGTAPVAESPAPSPAAPKKGTPT